MPRRRAIQKDRGRHQGTSELANGSRFSCVTWLGLQGCKNVDRGLLDVALALAGDGEGGTDCGTGDGTEGGKEGGEEGGDEDGGKSGWGGEKKDGKGGKEMSSISTTAALATIPAAAAAAAEGARQGRGGTSSDAGSGTSSGQDLPLRHLDLSWADDISSEVAMGMVARFPYVSLGV